MALCFGAAALGSVATAPAIGGWYRALDKPSWTPPDAVFGPVWTALYASMAVAGWLVWRAGRARVKSAAVLSQSENRDRATRRTALALFVVQLALNVAWSWIFFGARSPGWAAIEIAFLWIAIVATAVAFFRASPAAGVLMLPYLIWVSFATVLNVAIWSMNRD